MKMKTMYVKHDNGSMWKVKVDGWVEEVESVPQNEPVILVRTGDCFTVNYTVSFLEETVVEE